MPVSEPSYVNACAGCRRPWDDVGPTCVCAGVGAILVCAACGGSKLVRVRGHGESGALYPCPACVNAS